MPSITFTGDGLEAFRLYQLTEALTGDEASLAARESLRKRILKAWPELEKAPTTEAEHQERDKMLKEPRDFDITPTQQTALAEGFLKIIQDTKRLDSEKMPYLAFAKKCKFAGWLDRQMTKKALKEFTEADGEEVVPDAEGVPA